MIYDPFSDILRLADARSVVTGGFTAGGSWSIRFPVPGKLKFFGIVTGSCWLRIEGEAKPVRLEAGDVLLLSVQRSFVLAGDLTTEPVEAHRLFVPGHNTNTQIGTGKDCSLIGGHVQLDQEGGSLLAEALPPLILVRAASPQAIVLQWLLAQLVQERAGGLPGAEVASVQLAQLLFVQLLRVYLADADALPVGWLRALSDPRIAPALRLMHGEPGHPWQLGELAQAACMSRTTFTVRFKAATGVAPLTYLLHWRMRLAAHALREQNLPLLDIAVSLGYTSDSAFSHAFTRVVGMAPKRYRMLHQNAVPSGETTNL